MEALKYVTRFLVDRNGKPLPITEMTATALQAVGTMGHLERLAAKGDDRAAAFVTRLTGYLDQLHAPITANRPLTTTEQALFDDFRREKSHAQAYYHLCGQ